MRWRVIGPATDDPGGARSSRPPKAPACCATCYRLLFDACAIRSPTWCTALARARAGSGAPAIQRLVNRWHDRRDEHEAPERQSSSCCSTRSHPDSFPAIVSKSTCFVRFSVSVLGLVLAACDATSPKPPAPPDLSGSWSLRDSVVIDLPAVAYLRDVQFNLSPSAAARSFSGTSKFGEQLRGSITAVTYRYPEVQFTFVHSQGQAGQARDFSGVFQGAFVDSSRIAGRLIQTSTVRGDTAILGRVPPR